MQPVVDADYAFVIHTVNPSTGDEGELYARGRRGPGRGARGELPGPRSVLLLKKASAAEASADSMTARRPKFWASPASR